MKHVRFSAAKTALVLALTFGDVPAAMPAESARTACDERMPPPIDPRHRVDDLAAFVA